MSVRRESALQSLFGQKIDRNSFNLIVNRLLNCPAKELKNLVAHWVPKAITLFLKHSDCNLDYSALNSLAKTFSGPFKPFREQLERVLGAALAADSVDSVDSLDCARCLITLSTFKYSASTANKGHSTQELLVKVVNTLEFLLGQTQSSMDVPQEQTQLTTLRFSLPSVANNPDALIHETTKYSQFLGLFLEFDVPLTIDILPIINYIVQIYSLDLGLLQNSKIDTSALLGCYTIADNLLSKIFHRFSCFTGSGFSQQLSHACLQSLCRPRKFYPSAYQVISKGIHCGIFSSKKREILEKYSLKEIEAMDVAIEQLLNAPIQKKADTEEDAERQQLTLDIEIGTAAFAVFSPKSNTQTLVNYLSILCRILIKYFSSYVYADEWYASALPMTRIAPQLLRRLRDSLFGESDVSKAILPIAARLFRAGAHHFDHAVMQECSQALTSMHMLIHPKNPPQMSIVCFPSDGRLLNQEVKQVHDSSSGLASGIMSGQGSSPANFVPGGAFKLRDADMDREAVPLESQKKQASQSVSPGLANTVSDVKRATETPIAAPPSKKLKPDDSINTVHTAPATSNEKDTLEPTPRPTQPENAIVTAEPDNAKGVAKTLTEPPRQEEKLQPSIMDSNMDSDSETMAMPEINVDDSDDSDESEASVSG